MTHVLRAGGAQAVAAMAWGTETCPKARPAPLPLQDGLVSLSGEACHNRCTLGSTASADVRGSL